MSEQELPPVPKGPIDAEPLRHFIPEDARRALLRQQLAAAGVELGGYDESIVDWLCGWEGDVVLTVASWIRRARDAERAS